MDLDRTWSKFTPIILLTFYLYTQYIDIRLTYILTEPSVLIDLATWFQQSLDILSLTTNGLLNVLFSQWKGIIISLHVSTAIANLSRLHQGRMNQN